MVSLTPIQVPEIVVKQFADAMLWLADWDSDLYFNITNSLADKYGEVFIYDWY